MKTADVDIKALIAKASEIIAPLWPMQTIIARNPLQGIEFLKFEEAITIGEMLFSGGADLAQNRALEVNRELVKWCQVFLDEGQATITMPGREKGFYHAWLSLAPFDSTLAVYKKNQWLLSLPVDAEKAILFCLKKLAISDVEIEKYLKYSLAELPGWAGYIKWRNCWQGEEKSLKNPITLTDFLAVRLAITCAIDGDLKIEESKNQKISADFFRQLNVKENEYIKKLLKVLTPDVRKKPLSRADAQIVFCIDVRSEPFRRCIESKGNYETFGFAGFFGLPVSVRSFNTGQVKDCCPVLVKPRHEVHEEPIFEENKRVLAHKKGKSFLSACRRFYNDLKYNFATPFALVETLGLWCGFSMAIRTLLPVRGVRLRQSIQQKIEPKIATVPRIDIPLADQIAYAESALRLIGMTKNFSRLVVFCGHGSQTENNPYASALDCGACGGNRGGPNGKILAAILNSSVVRLALEERGIAIPDDTLFVGAEHNTTTDEVAIEPCGFLDETHKKICEQLQGDLRKAGLANSQYRCKTFGLDLSPESAKNHVVKRSFDWAEVRPEWGLARNAAFIIGPRSLTKEVCLDGRCFLHSYEWAEDESGHLLETILTAPMVVAEWINTQYFFSTLNNTVYGSGSKITHNITGKAAVMQGNSSDLMHGLPLQSVNRSDDHSYHELLRLQVIVYAPRSKIDPLVEKHPMLQRLFFNGWVILIAIDPTDSRSYRLQGQGRWVEISDEATTSKEEKLSFSIALEKKIDKLIYNNKICVIATMHEKEQVIAPIFSDLLGIKIVKAKIDTDQLGTFTGEVERKGSPLSCVRQKCELAMAESKVAIGIASEGSFGPHPSIPMVTCGHEILYFVDQEKGFSLHQSLLSTKTNYCAEVCSDLKQLRKFCERALFPSHALIVMPNKSNKKSLIFKGVKICELLEELFLQCCHLSEDGMACVQTDMRAHMNPTRMEVIKELADALAKQLATPCPVCYNPGWGMVDTEKGLECQMCRIPTEMVKFEIFGCPKCLHKEKRSRQDGVTFADPQYCVWCNP